MGTTPKVYVPTTDYDCAAIHLWHPTATDLDAAQVTVKQSNVEGREVDFGTPLVITTAGITVIDSITAAYLVIAVSVVTATPSVLRGEINFKKLGFALV